jgi:hypothetical protein
MSAEDKYYANKLNNEKKAKEQTEEAKTAREDVTQNFLENDPRGKEMLKELQFKAMSDPLNNRVGFNKQKAVQDQVQAILAADMAADPAAAGLGGAGPLGKAFKAPEGFGNVIGVGSNPVLEAMTSQLEEAKRTNDLLATIASAGGGRTTSWLNAADAPAPSRASMLKSK